MSFEKTFQISVNNISLNEGEELIRLINSRFRVLSLSIKRSSLNARKRGSWGWESGL